MGGRWFDLGSDAGVNPQLSLRNVCCTTKAVCLGAIILRSMMVDDCGAIRVGKAWHIVNVANIGHIICDLS